jgi:hypothetical protein
MPSHRSDAEREALTIAVLEEPIEMSHKAIGQKVGLHRSTVALIRYGSINADVATHLPRVEPGALARFCTDCLHFTRNPVRSHSTGEHVGTCDIGFAEAENLTYARGCAAFWPVPDKKDTVG